MTTDQTQRIESLETITEAVKALHAPVPDTDRGGLCCSTCFESYSFEARAVRWPCATIQTMREAMFPSLQDWPVSLWDTATRADSSGCVTVIIAVRGGADLSDCVAGEPSGISAGAIFDSALDDNLKPSAVLVSEVVKAYDPDLFGADVVILEARIDVSAAIDAAV